MLKILKGVSGSLAFTPDPSAREPETKIKFALYRKATLTGKRKSIQHITPDMRFGHSPNDLSHIAPCGRNISYLGTLSEI